MELGISSLGFILDLGLLHKNYNLFDLLFYSTEACLNTAEEKDINLVEIIIDPPNVLEKEREVKFFKLINSYSVRTQIHGPFIDVNLCSHNNTISNASVTTYIQAAKICQKINAKIMTIHSGLLIF